MSRSAEQIFHEARDMPPSERAGYLKGACGGDASLRARVEALLSADAEAGVFLRTAEEAMHRAEGETVAAAPREQTGAQIGRYKLLQPIGEGGFGTVWMAEQREPVKRRVALKIIKLGMDTKQVIARFEAERQALAMMDHPNIAKVLDAGATEAGRPYFVMEYIKGVPILEYCDTEQLNTKARLELFSSVCHAIQHAHQKGIIHRDIKPSNVLVTLHDGVPVPKVIDFGIAKATSSELTAKTLFTEHRQMIGTPAYMSPEQAEMSGLDIDTRSDIYSLGVLLYELLTGTTPFDSKSLVEAGFAEMMRIIREVEPHKPSTRLSSLGDTGTRTAQQRDAADPKRLSQTLKGDLDWIVMKCLEKDRTRRYETASGLAADIKRHLNDEPVTAGAPSAGYKLRKFVKRNRAQVIAGGLVACALVLGFIGTSVGLALASRERERVLAQRNTAAKALSTVAHELERRVRDIPMSQFLYGPDPGVLSTPKIELAPALEGVTVPAWSGEEVEGLAAAATELMGKLDAARAAETRARKRAETISEFVTTALKASDAQNSDGEGGTEGAGQDMTILAAMDGAIKDIDSGRFKDDPETEAKLKNTIARILRSNGRSAQAEPLFVQALETYQRLHPGDHPDVAASLNEVAWVSEAVGRPVQAERFFVQALEMYQRLYKGDNDHVAALLNNIAELRESLGRAAEAEPLMVQSLEMNQRLYKGDHPYIAKGLDNLAKVRQSLGRYNEADALYVQALAMRRQLYKGDHPDLAVGLTNLGGLRVSMGRAADAEPLFVEALEIRRRLYRGDHPVIAESLSNLAAHRLSMGRAAEAEPLIAEALGMNQRLFSGDHPNVAHSLYTLSSVRLDLGRPAEAEPLCIQSLEMHQRLFKGDHVGVAMSLANLARARHALHKTAEARRSFDEALAMLRRLTPNGSFPLLRTLARSGSARLDNNDAAAALPELEEAVAMAEKILPPEHRQLLECREALEKCRAALSAQDKPDIKGGG